jgi:hypothetical protein
MIDSMQAMPVIFSVKVMTDPNIVLKGKVSGSGIAFCALYT